MYSLSLFVITIHCLAILEPLALFLGTCSKNTWQKILLQEASESDINLIVSTPGASGARQQNTIDLIITKYNRPYPAAVHSLWISPTFLNGFCITILSRVRLSPLLVHFFLPTLFLPFASLLMCLDTELCEQPASFAMTFCVLPSLCKVSMVVFWTTDKSAVFPMIV